MKEFVEKLIERLEEEKSDWNCDYNVPINKAIQIAKDLAEEHKHDMVTQLAMMYAKNIYVYGVDVTKAWESAVQNHRALEKAYIRGRQEESDKLARWQDEQKDNVVINGQYCWQTCGSTEHCKECRRLSNGDIDYYENYDFMAEEHNNGWISVEDALPEDVVLATTKDGILYIATYDTIYKEWFDDNFERKIDVIAWQPLPAPYKKGE